MLFSAYRLDQYPDPDGFMAQTALILSEYSPEVVIYVTDPRTGIQRHSKWPPTVNEIANACDEKVEAIDRQIRLDDWQKRKRISDEIQADRPKLAADFCKPGEITYGEFLERSGTVSKPPRPVGRFEAA